MAKSKLGRLVATLKDDSNLLLDDCRHDFTYRLYENKGVLIIQLRHRFRYIREPFGDEGLRVYSGQGGALPGLSWEVDERIVTCDQDRMREALGDLAAARIPGEALLALDGIPEDCQGPLCLTFACFRGRATYRWTRYSPPQGWEPLAAFAEAILKEFDLSGNKEPNPGQN